MPKPITVAFHIDNFVQQARHFLRRGQTEEWLSVRKDSILMWQPSVAAAMRSFAEDTSLLDQFCRAVELQGSGLNIGGPKAARPTWKKLGEQLKCFRSRVGKEPFELVPVVTKFPNRPPPEEPRWVHLFWIATKTGMLCEYPAAQARLLQAVESARTRGDDPLSDEWCRHHRDTVNRHVKDIHPVFAETLQAMPRDFLTVAEWKAIETFAEVERNPQASVAVWEKVRIEALKQLEDLRAQPVACGECNMPDDSSASNEPNLNAFYKTPQYCLEIIHAHGEFLQWQDKPGGLLVAGTMARLTSHWADILLPEAKRLNVSMHAFRLWHKGIVDASGLDGGMGERAWQAFRTVDQLWPKVEPELERLREAAISEATGQAPLSKGGGQIDAAPPVFQYTQIGGQTHVNLDQRNYTNRDGNLVVGNENNTENRATVTKAEAKTPAKWFAKLLTGKVIGAAFAIVIALTILWLKTKFK